ncbi:MAG: hypothetical protein JNL11_01295 [Bdellovibrionaceae bacterium]|nr:hypothetical protein [Pseudobdellovibrionaceae bacterium]
MKLVYVMILFLAAGPSWGWIVNRAGCATHNHPQNKNIVTYTSLDFEVGPQAKAVFSQTVRLENSPPNVGIQVSDYAKFGFFTELKKINPDANPFAALWGTRQYEGFVADNGTLYTYRGTAKSARVSATFTKRYSDGEPHMARIDIYTRENANSEWVLSESYSDCYLSVMH